jgi:hypothetical protein
MTNVSCQVEFYEDFTVRICLKADTTVFLLTLEFGRSMRHWDLKSPTGIKQVSACLQRKSSR